MKFFQFVINTRPTPKQRHRHNGKFVYTPKRTAEYERLVKLVCNSAMVKYKQKIFNKKTPVFLDVQFMFFSKIHMDGKPVTKRPDIDNLIKSLMDGLNGALYEDDNCVCGINATKVYGKKDAVFVTVKQII